MGERAAEWRLAPSEERSLVAVRRDEAQHRRSVHVLLATLLVVAPLVGLGVANAVLPPTSLALLAAALMVLSVLVPVRARRATRRGERYRRASEEAHDAVRGWTVEVTVRQGAAPTGFDRGPVWFEEGRLFFAGARTSFGLFASDVVPGTQARLAAEDEGARLQIELRAESPIRPISLELRPLEPNRARAAELGWALRSWLAQGSAGDGQLPPLALGPDAPQARTLLAEALVVSVVWALALPLAFGVALVSGVVFCYGLPVFAPLLFFVLRLGYREFDSPWERWQAWADRRRLGAS